MWMDRRFKGFHFLHSFRYYEKQAFRRQMEVRNNAEGQFRLGGAFSASTLPSKGKRESEYPDGAATLPSEDTDNDSVSTAIARETPVLCGVFRKSLDSDDLAAGDAMPGHRGDKDELKQAKQLQEKLNNAAFQSTSDEYDMAFSEHKLADVECASRTLKEYVRLPHEAPVPAIDRLKVPLDSVDMPEFMKYLESLPYSQNHVREWLSNPRHGFYERRKRRAFSVGPPLDRFPVRPKKNIPEEDLAETKQFPEWIIFGLWTHEHTMEKQWEKHLRAKTGVKPPKSRQPLAYIRMPAPGKMIRARLCDAYGPQHFYIVPTNIDERVLKPLQAELQKHFSDPRNRFATTAPRVAISLFIVHLRAQDNWCRACCLRESAVRNENGVSTDLMVDVFLVDFGVQIKVKPSDVYHCPERFQFIRYCSRRVRFGNELSRAEWDDVLHRASNHGVIELMVGEEEWMPHAILFHTVNLPRPVRRPYLHELFCSVECAGGCYYKARDRQRRAKIYRGAFSNKRVEETNELSDSRDVSREGSEDCDYD